MRIWMLKALKMFEWLPQRWILALIISAKSTNIISMAKINQNWIYILYPAISNSQI